MHPILIRIGDFFIPSYGVMIMVGVLAGLALGIAIGKWKNFDTESYPDVAFVAIFLVTLTITTLTEDAQEGIAAFSEKREPRWKGR